PPRLSTTATRAYAQSLAAWLAPVGRQGGEEGVVELPRLRQADLVLVVLDRLARLGTDAAIGRPRVVTLLGEQRLDGLHQRLAIGFGDQVGVPAADRHRRRIRVGVGGLRPPCARRGTILRCLAFG